MSDLSRFLKRQEGNVRNLYDKNLGDFVEEWKRPLIGAQGGVLLGAGIGAMTGNPLLGAAVGGMGGAAAGYQRTEEQQAKWAAADELERQERAKANAGNQLQDIITPYLPGDPDAPETPYTPPIAVNPGVTTPVTDENGLTIPGVNPDMGNISIGGGAGESVEEILNETERAKQMQLDLLNEQNAMKEQYRTELATTLNDQMERQFSEQTPAYLEDLNSRGLLRSSALGDRLASERAKMSASVNEQIALQEIQDNYGGVDQLSTIQDQYLSGRDSALSRKFSLEDYAKQIEASKLLGQATTAITPYQGSTKSGTAQAGLAGVSAGTQLASIGK